MDCRKRDGKKRVKVFNELKIRGVADIPIGVTTRLRTIYRTVNAEAAMLALEAVETSNLGRKLPEIECKWRSARNRVMPSFEFSPEVGWLIYTSKAIESLNREQRKVTKTQISFHNEVALMKLAYLEGISHMSEVFL